MALYQPFLATKAHTITPSDATDLGALGIKALYVGGAGNVAVKDVEGGAVVTFTAPPVGTILPIAVSRVMAATTATAIIGLA